MTLDTIDPVRPGPAPRGRPLRTAAPALGACLALMLCGGALAQPASQAAASQASTPAAGASASRSASPAASQAASPAPDKHVFSDVVTEVYDGTWTATFDRGAVGPTGTATFVLADFAGNWHDVGSAALMKGSVCGTKPRPVTVQLSQKAGFSFTVFGVDVSPQCPNLTVNVTHVTANTLEGTVEGSTFTGEQKIRMVRKPKATRRR